MAADLIGRFNDTQDTDFRHRVLVALVEAAIGNVGAASGSVGADKRTEYARSVIASPSAHLDQAVLLVVGDGTGPASSDTAVRTRMNNLWDAFSGVRAGE